MREHREKLGLGSLKPSELVKGLKDVEERAAKQAEREAKRKAAGGAINKNEALALDETGQRWSRWVILSIGGVLLLGLLSFGVLHWVSNRKVQDPEAAKRETRKRMQRYADLYSQRLDPFEKDDAVTGERFQAALKRFLEKDLVDLEKAAEAERTAKKQASMDLRDKISRTKRDLDFTDEWGVPLRFEVKGEATISISCSNPAVKPYEGTIPRR